MALTRRSSQRVSNSIWPGFVDAMTALLLVLMFVLTIFMVVQYVLRETISGQEDELDELTLEVSGLARALGLEQQRTANLEDQASQLTSDLANARATAAQQATLIDTLTGQISAQEAQLAENASRITSFEAQVATLLSQRDDALAVGEALSAEVSELEAAQTRLISEAEALQLALAQARDEVNAQEEAARLAAARREALEALAADLQSRAETAEASLASAAEALSEEEAARIAEAAAAEALRERLASADAELTAMTLALEARRQEAEDTLTLLAAAQAAEEDLTARLAAAVADRIDLSSNLEETQAQLARLRELAGSEEELREQLAAALAAKVAAEDEALRNFTDAQERAALLAAANAALDQEEARSADSLRRVTLLNEQVAALRNQLGSLQSLLDQAAERDSEAQVRIEMLGSQLNVALARAAAEERRRADMEEAERLRLEREAEALAAEAEELGQENQQLERYRSEFFGQLRDVLGNREGVQIVGDRFVFSSEVLFESASADLAFAGENQIGNVAAILLEVADQIPEGIDWILRVDGHTDNIPLQAGADFADNWELSQARALSVVRFMTEQLGFPPNRLAATGFGEYRPVNTADTSEARAQNRRIELKLTER